MNLHLFKNTNNCATVIKGLVLAASFSFAALTLTGCTGMSGSFSCNEMPGDHCTPVSVVNQQVEEGMYDPSSNSSSQDTTKNSKEKNDTKNSEPALASFAGFDLEGGDVNDGNSPIRESEMTTRIWIAPYTDEEDNFHQANLVYSVLAPSYWQGLSQAVIQKQG